MEHASFSNNYARGSGILIHRNGHLVYANPTLAEMLGYTREEMIGRNILEAIDPNERELIWKRTFSRLEGENPISRYEINLQKKSGEMITYEVLASLINFGGQPAILGNVLDVTHRNKMERELKESERRYDAFINSTTDLAFLKDESLRYLISNNAMQRHLGKGSNEILGKSDHEIFDHEIADAFRSSDLHVLECGSTIFVEEEIEGRIFETTKFLVPLENGRKAIGGLIRNVTERKLAERALQERERSWAVLVDNLPGFVYRCSNDPDWTMHYISEGCKNVIGYTPEEITNKKPRNFSDIIDPNYRNYLWNKWQDVLSEKGFFEDEYPIIDKEGLTRWVWERGQGVYGDDGQLLFLEGFVTEITARKTVENALKVSEENHRVLVENLNDVIFSIDLEGKVSYVSPVIESKSKYKCEEIVGKKFLDFVHPDDLPKLFEKYARVLEGDLQASEYRLRDKDGTMIHVSSYSRPLFQDGKPIGITGLLTDISERKKAEEALRKSEDLLKITLEAINDGIWDLHLDSKESYFSPRCYTMLGFRPDEFPRNLSSWRELIHSDDLPGMDMNLKDHVQNKTDGFSAEIRMITKSEEWRWFLVRGKVIELNSENQPVRVVGILSDITERKKTEAALIESEERYRTVAEFNYDWECWADTEGRLLYVSPSCERITGYSAQEFVNDPDLVTRIVHPDDRERVIEHFVHSKSSDRDQSQDLDFRIIHRDESTRWISHACRPVFGREGQPLGRRASNRDITERKKLEQQILQAQKMESIGTLAGGIAHDFNNLLQVTMGYSDLLLSGKSEHDPERSDLEKIHQAAQSGAELVRKLMTFSRKTEPAPVPLNLNQEIKHIEELLRRTITKMIDIRLELAPGLEPINADRSQIEQIIMNLAVNARDAISESGLLTIATENVDLDQSFCRRNLGAKPGHYVRLTVSDNGHGMEPEIVRHIFEPFYTTKELGRGTGLGLPMVYGIVKQHSGYITCSSKIGEGTVFNIYFPVIDAKSLEKKNHIDDVSVSGTETILLVEDEQFVRELGERILQANGYQVISVSNAEEALKVFSNNQNITLTILDLIMPEMGGKDCLKKMLHINPGAQILIATGYSGETSLGDCLDLGAKGFVYKPFRSRELLTEVRKILDKNAVFRSTL